MQSRKMSPLRQLHQNDKGFKQHEGRPHCITSIPSRLGQHIKHRSSSPIFKENPVQIGQSRHHNAEKEVVFLRRTIQIVCAKTTSIPPGSLTCGCPASRAIQEIKNLLTRDFDALSIQRTSMENISKDSGTNVTNIKADAWREQSFALAESPKLLIDARGDDLGSEKQDTSGADKACESDSSWKTSSFRVPTDTACKSIHPNQNGKNGAKEICISENPTRMPQRQDVSGEKIRNTFEATEFDPEEEKMAAPEHSDRNVPSLLMLETPERPGEYLSPLSLKSCQQRMENLAESVDTWKASPYRKKSVERSRRENGTEMDKLTSTIVNENESPRSTSRKTGADEHQETTCDTFTSRSGSSEVAEGTRVAADGSRCIDTDEQNRLKVVINDDEKNSVLPSAALSVEASRLASKLDPEIASTDDAKPKKGGAKGCLQKGNEKGKCYDTAKPLRRSRRRQSLAPKTLANCCLLSEDSPNDGLRPNSFASKPVVGNSKLQQLDAVKEEDQKETTDSPTRPVCSGGCVSCAYLVASHIGHDNKDKITCRKRASCRKEESKSAAPKTLRRSRRRLSLAPDDTTDLSISTIGSDSLKDEDIACNVTQKTEIEQHHLNGRFATDTQNEDIKSVHDGLEGPISESAFTIKLEGEKEIMEHTNMTRRDRKWGSAEISKCYHRISLKIPNVQFSGTSESIASDDRSPQKTVDQVPSLRTIEREYAEEVNSQRSLRLRTRKSLLAVDGCASRVDLKSSLTSSQNCLSSGVENSPGNLQPVRRSRRRHSIAAYTSSNASTLLKRDREDGKSAIDEGELGEKNSKIMRAMSAVEQLSARYPNEEQGHVHSLNNEDIGHPAPSYQNSTIVDIPIEKKDDRDPEVSKQQLSSCRQPSRCNTSDVKGHDQRDLTLNEENVETVSTTCTTVEMGDCSRTEISENHGTEENEEIPLRHPAVLSDGVNSREGLNVFTGPGLVTHEDEHGSQYMCSSTPFCPSKCRVQDTPNGTDRSNESDSATLASRQVEDQTTKGASWRPDSGTFGSPSSSVPSSPAETKGTLGLPFIENQNFDKERRKPRPPKRSRIRRSLAVDGCTGSSLLTTNDDTSASMSRRAKNEQGESRKSDGFFDAISPSHSSDKFEYQTKRRSRKRRSMGVDESSCSLLKKSPAATNDGETGELPRIEDISKAVKVFPDQLTNLTPSDKSNCTLYSPHDAHDEVQSDSIAECLAAPPSNQLNFPTSVVPCPTLTETTLSKTNPRQQGQRRRRRRSRTGLSIAGGGVLTGDNMDALLAESNSMQIKVKQRKNKKGEDQPCPVHGERPSKTKNIFSNTAVANGPIYGIKLDSSHDMDAVCASRHPDLSNEESSCRSNFPDKGEDRERFKQKNLNAFDERSSNVTRCQPKKVFSCGECKEKLQTRQQENGSDDTSKYEESLSTPQIYTEVKAAKKAEVKAEIKVEDAGEAEVKAEEISLRVPCSDEINLECDNLFGSHDKEKNICVSPRIFSCLFLLVRKNPSLVENKAPFIKPVEFSWINPFIPAFKALMHLEATVMKENIISMSGAKTIKAEAQDQKILPRKRVQFCSFSSITRPVDTMLGSQLHLERCIDALQTALQRIDTLCNDCVCIQGGVTRQELSVRAEWIVFALAMFEKTENFALREACAKALPLTEDGSVYPSSRLVHIARQYRLEFEELLIALIDGHSDGFHVLDSPLRKQLGELVGSAIRFNLRRLFNPVPSCYTAPSDEVPAPDYSACRSRIHELIRMTSPDSARNSDTAIADGSISSVLNLALQFIYKYYDVGEKKIALGYQCTQEGIAAVEETFCTSDGSRKGPTDDFSDEDFGSVMNDINEAHQALATARACKFVNDLLNWPGVEAAIREAGGWNEIENFAAILSQHNLEVMCPDVAHFLMLKDVDQLKNVLKGSCDSLDSFAKQIEESLSLLWSRFKCGTKRKALLRRNPTIRLVRDALLDDTLFPEFEVPSREGDC